MEPVPGEEFAKELVKQLPIKEAYTDAVAPGAKKTGQLIEDLVKTLQLALFPIQYLAALQDRYRAFLDRSVRRVPEDRRISPAPQIVGPILEAIRYEPEGTPIDEMFSELLSRSMDKDRVGEAHPAFPAIVRQLSTDEAKILKLLRDSAYPLVRYHTIIDNSIVRFVRNEEDGLPREGLFFPDSVTFYIQHLSNLGLAEIAYVPPQEPVWEGGKQIGIRIRNEYRLTEVGQRFVLACIPT